MTDILVIINYTSVVKVQLLNMESRSFPSSCDIAKGNTEQWHCKVLKATGNLTRGSEERIFSYENGKQVWW